MQDHLQSEANFPTPIGEMSVYWDEMGITKVAWTGNKHASTGGATSEQALPTAAPPYVRQAVDAIQQYFQHGKQHLATIRISDATHTPFQRRVYAACRSIPNGKTVSYGELAAAVGSPASARAIGQCMARNPWPIIVPCHRVLPADGSLGQYSGHGGPATKAWLLDHERHVPPD